MFKNKKIILFLVFTLIMSSLLMACGNKDNKDGENELAKNKIVDGTYEGVGQGRGGEIKLEVTIKDDQIEDIKVISHNETTGYETAMDTLAKEVIQSNSLDVDLVTGCTLTSNGFIEALENALENAGADKSLLRKVEKKDSLEGKQLVEETTDVLVIGAGGAGFAAAIEAKENGADVIILEKLPVVGGNTLISGGEYAAPNNWIQKEEGIEDSVEQFKQDILNGGDNIADEELVQVVAENALECAEWLRDDVGVVFEDELMFFGGHSVKRSLIPEGASGAAIIKKQKEKAESLGIPIYLNTKATELITDDNGKVIGAKAESEENDYVINTNNAVVIATGGFGSNLEMRMKYNPEIDENILSTNTVGTTGDGIIMAQELGAEVVGMEHIQTYPICDPLTGTLLYFDDARLYGHTILVNKEGKRFVEELGRRDEISMGIKAQTDHYAYELIDEKGFIDSKLEENHSAELEYLFDNDLLVKADTLEQAAKFFDIDYKNLQETVDNYNKYVKNGKDEEFNKRLLTMPIDEGPFYILKTVPAVHHTMGGLKINTDAQVITKDGNIIDGLYAAGEVTGGIHGTNRLGSNAIADIIVFGRIAGRNASK